MYRTWLQIFALLGGFAVPGLLRVGGMEVFTDGEVEAVNGTNVRLKCSFKSNHPVSLASVGVSWNFRPLGKGAEESVFFYQEAAYPPTDGRFKGHAAWAGDILKNDASIQLLDVPPTFNGTFTCQVRNRPDVHGINGEVVLQVVNKASYSEIKVLAVAVGVSIGAVLLILAVYVTVKVCRQRRSAPTDVELEAREAEWKDPTVCAPEEAVHLYIVQKELEVDSSDGEESEASSGGGEEEDGGEDEDDDDDDDDEGGGDDDDD